MSVLKLMDYSHGTKIAKGQNVVLSITHRQTNKLYALKKIRRTDFQKHISDLQELFITSSIHHQNIINIIGFSIETTRFNGVNEYILSILMDKWEQNAAEYISQRKKQSKPLTPQELYNIISNLIQPLAFMQKECKIAHRDLKPENILINKDGNMCLIDFSESFLENSIKSLATTLVGSPYYMSPELKIEFLNGAFSPIKSYNPWKSDVFSLGVCLLDFSSLTLGDEIKFSQKINDIYINYGQNFSNFIGQMLVEDPFLRPDFIELENKLEKLRQSIDEKIEYKTQNQITERKEERTKKSLLSEKIFKLIAKYTNKNGISLQLQKKIIIFMTKLN